MDRTCLLHLLLHDLAQVEVAHCHLFRRHSTLLVYLLASASAITSSRVIALTLVLELLSCRFLLVDLVHVGCEELIQAIELEDQDNTAEDSVDGT